MESGSEDERAPVKERVSFLGRDGAGYALGQVAAFYLAVAVLLVVFTVPVARVLAGDSTGVLSGIAFQSLPPVAAVATIVWYMTARGHWTMADAGWPRLATGFRWFCRGAGLGAAMVGIGILITVLLGQAEFRISAAGPGYVESAAAALGVLMVAALAEELVFRGFPLTKLAGVVGRAGASLILAVGFSLMHLWNPDPTVLGFLNIGLASLVLSAVFFTTGGLAAAWGLHFGWNSGLMLADIPVSGIAFDLPRLDYFAGRPTWLTGGDFGLEGGVAASIVMAAALVFITRKWISQEKA